MLTNLLVRRVKEVPTSTKQTVLLAPLEAAVPLAVMPSFFTIT